MEHKKKKIHQLDSTQSFEEKDHKLACGWYVDVEGSGQRKRFLRSLDSDELKNYA